MLFGKCMQRYAVCALFPLIHFTFQIRKWSCVLAPLHMYSHTTTCEVILIYLLQSQEVEG